MSKQIGLPNALRRSRRAKRVHGLLPTPSILPLHRCHHPCGCHPRHHPLHRRPHRHPRPPPLSPHSLHHHRPHPPSPSPQLHPRHLERRHRRSDGRSKTRRRKCKMGAIKRGRSGTKACSAYATQDQDAPLADAGSYTVHRTTGLYRVWPRASRMFTHTSQSVSQSISLSVTHTSRTSLTPAAAAAAAAPAAPAALVQHQHQHQHQRISQ